MWLASRGVIGSTREDYVIVVVNSSHTTPTCQTQNVGEAADLQGKLFRLSFSLFIAT
jgi:hypothetical protein